MDTDREKIKLNLGCGLNAPVSWNNYDSSLHAQIKRYSFIYSIISKMNLVNKDSQWPENVHYLNLNKKLPWADETVDVIYLSHVIEHLSKKVLDQLLEESYRVLKNKGVIRIVVPDMLALAKQYVETTDESSSSIDQLLWAMNLSIPCDNSKIRWLYNIIMKHPSVHKYMYDYATLSKNIVKYGYSNIVKCDYGVSSYINDILVLEHTSGYSNSLYLEAQKIV